MYCIVYVAQYELLFTKGEKAANDRKASETISASADSNVRSRTAKIKRVQLHRHTKPWHGQRNTCNKFTHRIDLSKPPSSQGVQNERLETSLTQKPKGTCMQSINSQCADKQATQVSNGPDFRYQMEPDFQNVVSELHDGMLDGQAGRPSSPGW